MGRSGAGDAVGMAASEEVVDLTAWCAVSASDPKADIQNF